MDGHKCSTFHPYFALVFLGCCYFCRDERVVYDHVSEDTNLTLFRVFLLKVH